MNNKEFSKILHRYLQGEATEAERALVEQWYDLLDEQSSNLPEAYEQAMEDRVWAKLEASIQEEQKRPLRKKGGNLRRLLNPLSIAIAAAIVGVVVWLGASKGDGAAADHMEIANMEADDYQTITNEINGSKDVSLSDGSMVRLAPGATLKYPHKFHPERREVYLNGEAFFDIAPKNSQPFYVYAGKVTTHVLGTSFTIKPMAEGKQIEVSVHTGRVEVFETINPASPATDAKQSKGVVLTPNQRVVYYAVTGVFEPTVVAAPMPLIEEDKRSSAPSLFQFEDTPLLDVLKALEQTYGIEIMVEKKDLYKCPFTGDLTEQGLFEKLDIINLALGTTYEVKGTRILIKGNGCE
jgi:ferric-dicitrate binding protein FerR (iron transport regulator)